VFGCQEKLAQLKSMILATQTEALTQELQALQRTAPGEVSKVLDMVDDQGLTLFLLGVRMGSKGLPIVEQLLHFGASIAARDGDGHSALHLAACSPVDDPEVVKLLIRRGVSVADVSDFKETAAHRASRYGCVRCLALLLQLGADPRARNANALSVLDVAGVIGVAVSVEHRHQSRHVILEHCKAMRTLVMTHDDCTAHAPWKGHQESPERITAIMHRLADSTMFHPLDVVVARDAEPADEVMVTRAHSKVWT
jgi:hypothetical protein